VSCCHDDSTKKEGGGNEIQENSKSIAPHTRIPEDFTYAVFSRGFPIDAFQIEKIKLQNGHELMIMMQRIRSMAAMRTPPAPRAERRILSLDTCESGQSDWLKVVLQARQAWDSTRLSTFLHLVSPRFLLHNLNILGPTSM
jgi:hypothetical protein